MTHFIGLGGIGMSGLAKILLERGQAVSGSDPGAVPEELVRLGARVFPDHRAENIAGATCVVVSTAIRSDNPELIAAKEKGLPILHRSQLLARIVEGVKGLAVTGTHGKTTTSCLLAAVLVEAGWLPTYSIGGVWLQAKTNGAHGGGEYAVFEADESDGSFLQYHPYGAIVTNIDNDHLDHFGCIDVLEEAFERFICNVSGPLFWCYDDARLRTMNPTGTSYGFMAGADVLGSNWRQEGFRAKVDISAHGNYYHDVPVHLPGKHYALNALAVFGLALELGISEEVIRRAFDRFSGVARRLERKYDKEVLLLDDYGHHPTEIDVTLRTIREAIGSRRLICLFQPHRFSRTHLCFDAFPEAFRASDVLLITDLYSAGEMPIEGISSQTLAAAIERKHSGTVQFSSKQDLVELVMNLVQPSDVVVTIGAGDITKISDHIARRLNV